MKENSIEEDIKNAEHFINSIKTDKEYQEENGWHGYYNKEIVELARMLEHILSAYKRALKENERYQKSDYETICLENNELREITDRIQSEYNDLLKDNFKLKDELETKRKEYQETYKDVREELKELRKDNEELKDTNCLVKRYFKLKDTNTYLQKENDELRKIKEISSNITEEDIDRAIKEAEKQYIPVQKIKDKIEEIQKVYNKLDKEVDEKDKIIQNMSKYILSLDIDKDICMKNTTNTELCNEDNSNCIECIKKHFSN